MTTQTLDSDMPWLEEMLAFLRGAEALKSTLRTAWTATGRQESTAEHSWRLCLLAMLMAERYPHLDGYKLIKLCIVHDLAEAISGDIAAPLQQPDLDKHAIEKRDLTLLLAPLDAHTREQIMSLWLDYDLATSEEAKLAKALDKLETIMQHNQGQNPPDFDHAFNLHYGKKQTEFDANTQALRQRLDEQTRQNLQRIGEPLTSNRS